MNDPWSDEDLKPLIDAAEQNVVAPDPIYFHDDIKLVWTSRLTQPIPTNWTGSRFEALDYYVYSRLFDPNITCGERVSKAWLRIRRTPSGTAEPEALSDRIEEAGIQGVRPLSIDENQIYNTWQNVSLLLRQRLVDHSKITAREADGIRKFYRLWRDCNGVIVEDTRCYHRSFFKWLDRWSFLRFCVGRIG